MCDWYERFCIDGEEPIGAVSRQDCMLTAKELNQKSDTLHFVVSALALERFKKYLNAKLKEGEMPVLIEKPLSQEPEAEKILTESDCFIYEAKLIGLPPSEASLANQRVFDETLATKQREGKILVQVCCSTTGQIITGGLKIGLTQSELNVFIGKFKGHQYRDLGRSPHYDKEKDQLNTSALLGEIFSIASAFDNPVLGDYFLKSAFEEVQRRNNDSWASHILVFNKQYKERLAIRNTPAIAIQTIPKGEKPSVHKDLPVLENAIKEPEKLPVLWMLLSEMEMPFVSENGNIIGGKKARKHREVMALAQAITPLMKAGNGQFEVYSMLCKRLVLAESSRPERLPNKPGYNDIRLRILEAIRDLLK